LPGDFIKGRKILNQMSEVTVSYLFCLDSSLERLNKTMIILSFGAPVYSRAWASLYLKVFGCEDSERMLGEDKGMSYSWAHTQRVIAWGLYKRQENSEPDERILAS
jgi:hypothetical protein